MTFVTNTGTLISTSKRADRPKPKFLEAATIEAQWGNDGLVEPGYVLVAYSIGDETYLGKSAVRIFRPTALLLKLEELYDVIPVPKAQLRPLYEEGLTIAPDPLPEGTYVKQPRYCEYDPNYPELLPDTIISEARNNELLLSNPHPNIAKYHGCQVKDGYITGLCFDNYRPLSLVVDPDHKGKLLFDADMRPLKDLNLYLQGIRDGIKHLHSLGMAHNNLALHSVGIRPGSNDDMAIIAELEMCQRFNTPIERDSRVEDWSDLTINASLPSNDTDAIEELERYLTGDKNYRFGA
ncbi:hypothetical protein EPUS_09500 [Endocarpon pusillum Z07020]|uniref:Protein kinase domain-containing protein n=1 Tax=Endocarpon pusillum (strain Z07020 / HMAS-L-300199) TaxID=1263415 RepID=U1HW03_ENDPU|nr:uncharacterized protein EPUS_09500 [Endocarpon pusillum Z07020]ERF73559.1 hypothetical protein EPUS_09500 [Endocarpon pusillum Z07020]